MADNLFKIQSDNPDDMEMAAALAAIYALIAEEKTTGTSRHSNNTWMSAGRLESCLSLDEKIVRPLPISCLLNLWQTSTLKFLTLSMIIIMTIGFISSILPAHAQIQHFDLSLLTNQENLAIKSVSQSADTIFCVKNIEPHCVGAMPCIALLNRELQSNTVGANPISQSTQNTATAVDSFTQISIKPVVLKVALQLGANYIKVELPDGAELQDSTNNNQITLPPQTKIAFSYEANNEFTWRILSFPTANQDAPSYAAAINSFTGSIIIKPIGNDALFGINGKFYRGQLSISKSTNTTNGINAINMVDLEDYLLSVVPSEMPSSWPFEALKAQAIAARSYALANLGKHESDGYDLKSTTDDQVYTGVAVETQATNKAVAETSALVLKCAGNIIPAFFHSTSGGATHEGEPIQGKIFPFLKSVPDYDDNSPLFTWAQQFTPLALEAALIKNGYNVGNLQGLFILSQSPNKQNILVAGSNTVKLITGNEIRRILGLPSANFNIGMFQQNYLIAGRGFGHGLGMSQWGAKALAENGYNAAQILTYYYKDVSLDYM